jgi:hypothetical protein
VRLGVDNLHAGAQNTGMATPTSADTAAQEGTMLPYPGTPTDPTVYAQVHGPAVIAFLSETADGTIFRSEARVIAAGAVRRVMSVMGVKLFYGLRRDGAIVEYVLTGTRFVSAEREARAECALLWEPGAFCGKTWEVYGVVREVAARHDLSPVETTVHAARWARALGF